MTDETRQQLANLLAEATGQYSRGVLIADLIERAIDEAVETHRENSPHIYPDGSTY